MAEALEASGLSIAKFAQHHGLTSQRVYWWLERLGRREKGSKRQAVEAAFVPVRVAGFGQAGREVGAGDTSLELVVGGSTVIRVRRGFDVELLRQVVATLEGTTC